MKKITHLFAVATLLISFISCNKSMDSGAGPVDLRDDQDIAGKGCCCQCPSAVPDALDISYSLSFWQPEVVIMVDIVYENNGPDGSLRVVLRNENGDIDSVAIVNAPHTNSGATGIIQMQYSVPESGFPYRLIANGRPANLDCEIRVRKTFLIENEVSKK